MSESNSKMPGWLQLSLLIGIPVIIFLLIIGFNIQKQNSAATVLQEESQTDTVANQDNLGTSTPTSSSTSSSSTNLSTNNGETMKTLADFTPISADQATLHTSRGDITFELYGDKTPLTVTNFLTLVGEGYYNNLKFHRVIDGFMAQTGDPYSRDDGQQGIVGTGGPGYTIEDEFDDSLKHDSIGVVSMANVGQPNTGGGQFFITFAATPWLDGQHAVFGKVTDEASLKVLQSIKQDDVIFSVDYK